MINRMKIQQVSKKQFYKINVDDMVFLENKFVCLRIDSI